MGFQLRFFDHMELLLTFQGQIFEQEQIARAAELGIGVRSAQDIQLVLVGDESVDFATKITQMLKTR